VSERRHAIRHLRTRRRLLTLVAGLGLLTSSCSGQGSTSDTVPPTSSTTGPPRTTTTSTTSTTTATTTTTTARPVVTPEGVLAGWNAFWDVWVLQGASDPIDRMALEEVASSEVVDGVIALFQREREKGARLTIRRVIPSGVVEDIGDGTASLTACTLISRSLTGRPGTLYDAVLVERDGAWIVDELSVVTTGGCVPVAVAEAAIGAYEAYWDDRDSMSNPADPDAPWLKHRTVGEHLEVLTEGYTDLQERGLYFQGRPETHPEIVEVLPDWSLVILDCMVVPPDWGVFDVETNARTDDARDPGPEGRIDLRSARMENDDRALLTGEWRVATLAGEVDASCEFAPTEDGLPQS